MKFKQFIVEGVKENIITIINDMTDSELQEFGEWLYDVYLGYGEIDDESMEESADDSAITKEEIIELLGDLSITDLEFIYSLFVDVEEESTTHHHTEENPNIAEGDVSRRLQAQDRNRKKRKKFTTTKADLRRTKVERKKAARMNRAARKRYYRANKVKLTSYGKSYRDAVDTGKHNKKIRVSA